MDQKVSFGAVKAQFDEVLVKHIRRLLEIDTLAASLSFNLSTIACLLLLVERENEIKKFPASPPDRYTREAFLDDLQEIGLEVDDEMMVAFQMLAQHGYVDVASDNKYHAQIGAFALVSFLDNLFPGMPGMSFVSYVLQIINEVVAGSKDIENALNQFDQTLLSRGIPLSQQKLKQIERENLDKQATHIVKRIQTGKISDDLKKSFVDRLGQIRSASGRSAGGPKVIREDGADGATDVVDVFPSRHQSATNREGPQPVSAPEPVKDQAALEAEKKAEAERAAAERARIVAERQAAETAAREAERRANEIAAKEAEIRAKEAEIRAREAEIKAKEIEATELQRQQADASEPDSTASSPVPDDIESKIAAFEQNLTMPCPVCQTGRIREQRTEKGQEYFACTNERCGFISWGKPYPFECPMCKNAFLIEFTAQEGKPGLKCPRASCSFWQNFIGPPGRSGDSEGLPKKKKKYIRRVKRK